MSKPILRMLTAWLEISAAVRRYPLLDYVMALVLCGWGAEAIWIPHEVVHARVRTR